MALAELRVLEALRASNSPHSHSPPSARPLPRSSSMRNLVVNTRTLVRTVSFTARALLQSTSFRAEVAAIVALVPPGVGRGLSNFIPTFITFVLIGRLGNEALAAFSLGEAWRGLQAEKHKGVHAAPSDAVDAWMFGLAFVVWEGLNNAQKKCVSTAHGAQNAAAVRGWFLITMGAGMACSVLLAGCWAASAPLIFAIKPSVSSSVISDYSLWFIPSLPFFMVSSVVACQLGALQRPVVPFVLEVIGALIDVSLSFVFVLGAGPAFVGLGVTGAPLASLVEQAFLAPAFVYAAWRLLQGEMGGSRTLDEHRPHQDALLSSPVSVSSSPRALASSRSIGTTSPLSFRIKTIHVARITPVSDDLLPAVTSRAEGSSYGSDAATFRSAASDSPLAPEVGALRFTFRTAAVHPFSPPVLPGCATGIAVSNSILASGSSSPQAAELTRWAPAFAFATQVTHWKHFIYLFWNCFFTAALEQWQLQALVFMSAALSTTEIGAFSAMLSLVELLSRFVDGFGDALSVRVAYHLGRGAITDAKIACLAGIVCALVWSVSVVTLIVTCAPILGRMFSDDADFLYLFASVAPIAAASYVALTASMMTRSALQGQGRTSAPVVSFFVGSWLVGVPLACAFLWGSNLGVAGLLIAITAGYSFTAVIGLAYLLRANWLELGPGA